MTAIISARLEPDDTPMAALACGGFGLVPALLDLEPVSLDEVNAAAELLTRRDRKYVLTRSQLMALLDGPWAGERVLEIDQSRQFSYHSTYFDTPDLVTYHLAATNRRRRYKLRLRQVGPDGARWLEVKTRGPRALTVKDRLMVSPARPTPGARPGSASDDAWLLGPDGAGFEWATITLAERGITPPPTALWAPSLSVNYRRTTILLPDGAGRVTLDTDLAWTAPTATGQTDLIVLETKTEGPASAWDRRAWSLGLRPLRCSKYAVGLALLRGLPANRWQPVLRRLRPDLNCPGPNVPSGASARVSYDRLNNN